MTVVDILVLGWVAAVVAATYVGLPWLVHHFSNPDTRASVAGLSAGLLLTMTAGVTLLSAVSLVNAVTVVALHAVWAVVMFVWSHRSFGRAAQRLLRAAVNGVAWPSATGSGDIDDTSLTRPQLAACAMIAVTLMVTRVLPALSEARLFHPLGYEQLHLIRRVLAGALPHEFIPPFAAWIASVVTLGAVDASYVVRFLPPLLACAVTACLVWTVYRLCGRFEVALVAGFAWLLTGSGLAVATPWAATLAHQHAAAGQYVAAMLVLLLVGRRDAQDQKDQRVGTFVAAISVALFSPALVPVAAAACAPRRIRLGATALAWLGVTWIGLASDAPAVVLAAAPTIPVGIALGCAAVYDALRPSVRTPAPSTAGAYGLLVMLATASVTPPHVVREHDSAARQALHILRETAGDAVIVVGREMPLLRGEPSVRQQSMAAFVACENGGWCTRDESTSTYLFVQKRPFDSSEVIAEQRGLVAAERLVHVTPGARVYHDDDTLRVYELPGQP